MSDATPANDFLTELTAIIERNIANESFGVSELADEMNMSRSNLLRKVKKETKLSVSQLISQVRLKRAMELLRKTSSNVSEVSHQVGFNSPSYFIKCFREYYGYPPGEVGKREEPTPPKTGKLPENIQEGVTPQKRNLRIAIAIGAIATVVVLTMVAVLWSGTSSPGFNEDKSIAVLPFKNDSGDSSNIYLINGLMEATLHKLQQVQNLRVISRTSVEKYRNTPKSIPEMGKELNVKYFVEGSGQKMGDRILLNIQLIEAATDKHLWSKQYRREAKDIFELQEEIARNITQEIEVFVTPEEKDRIEKKPTDDPVAYDYYLKGKELFYRSGRMDLEGAVPWFKKAIEKDPKFSLAYATLSMVYYYLDIFSLQKMYTTDIDNCAEKALLYDSKSSESMIAKALSFAQKNQHDLSVPYLEKALEYDPNSGLVLHFLTEFYNIHVPHPAKYLEFAIRKVQVDKGTDSATLSHDYFHLSNALVQTGFLDEALKYSNKSLALNPKHYFAGFVNDYIHFAIDRDAAKVQERLMARWKKDTLRFDILFEAGRASSMAGDHATAKSCFDKSLAMMKMFGMDIYKHEYLRVGMVYEKMGEKEKAKEYIRQFKDYCEKMNTMYKDLQFAAYYAHIGQKQKGIELFERFAKEQDNFLYWILLMSADQLDHDLQDCPEFEPAMKEIERKFWKKHEELDEKFGDTFREL